MWGGGGYNLRIFWLFGWGKSIRQALNVWNTHTKNAYFFVGLKYTLPCKKKLQIHIIGSRVGVNLFLEASVHPTRPKHPKVTDIPHNKTKFTDHLPDVTRQTLYSEYDLTLTHCTNNFLILDGKMIKCSYLRNSNEHFT